MQCYYIYVLHKRKEKQERRTSRFIPKVESHGQTRSIVWWRPKRGINSVKSRIPLLSGTFYSLSFLGCNLALKEPDEEL